MILLYMGRLISFAISSQVYVARFAFPFKRKKRPTCSEFSAQTVGLKRYTSCGQFHFRQLYIFLHRTTTNSKFQASVDVF